jgi:hypothetical protein
VTWADSVPNLLIGLREGLEAGLVVTILLAAVRKTAAAQADRGGEPRVSTPPIWLGVLGAVTLAGAFAAVLTFSASVLSSAGQEAVGGLLGVFTVLLVTAMIFWMRRTAATLSSHLIDEPLIDYAQPFSGYFFTLRGVRATPRTGTAGQCRPNGSGRGRSSAGSARASLPDPWVPLAGFMQVKAPRSN